MPATARLMEERYRFSDLHTLQPATAGCGRAGAGDASGGFRAARSRRPGAR